MQLSTRSRRNVDIIAVSITALTIADELLPHNLFAKTPFPGSIVDYSLMYCFSRDVVHTHMYPTTPFPYSPAGVILQWLTALFPLPVSATLWMALTAAAAVTCWWLLIKMLGLDKTPGALVVLPLAYAFSSYYFGWDLSQQNSNLVFLGATMVGVYYLHNSRPIPAALGIVIGVSLKLYSFLLIPYLLLTRRFRELAWTIVFLGVFWVLMPVAVFGLKGSADVYHAWLHNLQQSAGLPVDQPHRVLISLARSAYHLWPNNPGKAAALVDAFRVAWLALLSVACIAAIRRPQNPTDAFALLSDVSLLILAPVALSPYLEPYHPVAAAIAGLLLLVVAADPRQPQRNRILAATCFALALSVRAVPSPWEIRGLMVNLKLILAVSGTVTLVAVRARLSPTQLETAPSIDSTPLARAPLP